MTGADLTLIAVGDITNRRAVPSTYYDGIRSVLRQGDIIMGNQEGPTLDSGQPAAGKFEAGSRHLCSVAGAIAAQAEAGFSAVTLANNHIMDYGEDGLFQTIALLREHGIVYAGAGANLAEARRPAILERNGLKIAMLCYTSVYPTVGFAAAKDRPGVATIKVHTSYQAPENVFYQPGVPAIIVTIPDQIEWEAALADIRQAREQADLVVVHFHWGVAQTGHVLGYMQEMGRAAIDEGADLIIGSHPPRLVGFEIYRGKLISYSFNHLYKDGVRPVHGQAEWAEAALLKVGIRDGRFERFSVIPVYNDPDLEDTVLAKGERFESTHRTLERLCAQFGTTFTREGDELVIGGPRPGTPPPLRAPEVLAYHPVPVAWPTSRDREPHVPQVESR